MSSGNMKDPTTIDPLRPERQKPWPECGIEEKIERLRDALRNLQWTARHQAESVPLLEANFNEHSHGADGLPWLPISRKHGYGMSLEKLGRERDPLE